MVFVLITNILGSRVRMSRRGKAEGALMPGRDDDDGRARTMMIAALAFAGGVRR